MTGNRSESRRDRNGLPLAILAAWGGFLAFTRNPVGWGWFDWVAVTAFSAAAIWNLYRFLRHRRHGSHA